jgi:hypothetical protein
MLDYHEESEPILLALSVRRHGRRADRLDGVGVVVRTALNGAILRRARPIARRCQTPALGVAALGLRRWPVRGVEHEGLRLAAGETIRLGRFTLVRIVGVREIHEARRALRKAD